MLKVTGSRQQPGSRLKTDSLTPTNTLLTIFHLKWWSLELLKLLGKFLGNYDFLTRSYHDAFDYYNFLEGSSDIVSGLQILKDCLQSSIVLPSWIQYNIVSLRSVFLPAKKYLSWRLCRLRSNVLIHQLQWSIRQTETIGGTRSHDEVIGIKSAAQKYVCENISEQFWTWFWNYFTLGKRS